MEEENTLIRSDFELLRARTGVAPWTLIDSCPKCLYREKAAELVERLGEHNCILPTWIKTLRCARCSGEWGVCTECSNQRQPFLTAKHIRRHHKSNHNASTAEIREVSQIANRSMTEEVDDIDATAFAQDTEAETVMTAAREDVTVTVSTEKITFPYSTSQSSKFFEMENTKDGLGSAFLVAKSQFGMELVADRLDKDEVKLQLKVASLVSTMTKTQRRKFVEVMDQQERLVHKRAARRIVATQTSDQSAIWTTRLPRTRNDVRSLYIEGKDAFLANLPRPPVSFLKSHAYVSLGDCLADLLGHGFELDEIKLDNFQDHQQGAAIKRISQTARAKEIYQNSMALRGNITRKVICLYLNEWSDGFEPHISIKANRGSVWVKTVTISPMPGNIHSLSNTYPIAIGKGEVSHEEVERRFAEELSKLRSGGDRVFYHGGLRENVLVHLDLFVSLMDQPERRSANYIMLGTSTFTARWGHAGDFTAMASGIPACASCMQSKLGMTGLNTMTEEAIAHTDGSPTMCTRCTNWNTEADSGLLDFEPPENYPVELLPASKMLRPMKITYQKMRNAVELCHRKIVMTHWSLATGRSYLKVHGMNTEAVGDILECAANCRQLVILERGKETNPQAYAEILLEKESNPGNFALWEFPSLWTRGVELEQHIDVTMHLLFLGVIKTTMNMVQEWAKKRNKYTAFLKYASRALDMVQTLNLDWLKAIPYGGGKLGGWVSENYMAMGRVSCWFYEPLEELGVDPVFVEPTRPYGQWTAVSNRGWLKSRGLSTVGKAAELRERVAVKMEQDGGPPAVQEPEGGSVSNLNNMIIALNAMVCRLMCRTLTEHHVEDVEKHIKIFLSCFEIFDRQLRGPGEKPTWLSSYNFICLLNLPGMLRRFGPLRNLWEGGGGGGAR